MKKKLSSLALSYFAIFIFTSCSNNKLQFCCGVVEEVSHSLLTVTVNGKRIDFEASDAQYRKGAVMHGDSVNIHYIGKLGGDCKALLVNLIPNPSIVDAEYDANKHLITTSDDNRADIEP